MLTIHHLGVSQSDRIVWLCEELELPHALKRYARDAVTRMAPPAYRALHPFGTAPVIVDGEIVLGESAAIIEYIVARYGGGRLIPTSSEPDFVDYLFWFHFANGSLQPSVMMERAVGLLEAADKPMAPILGARAGRAYAAVEQRLGQAPYFAGEAFTAADVMMLFR